MTELFFYETRILRTPVSIAVDIGTALLLGLRSKSSPIVGWYELELWLGPLCIAFTIYRRSV